MQDQIGIAVFLEREVMVSSIGNTYTIKNKKQKQKSGQIYFVIKAWNIILENI